MKHFKDKGLPPLPNKNPNHMKQRDQTVHCDNHHNHAVTNSNLLSLVSDPQYDNTHTITWFRNKFNKTQIANSINNLISYTGKKQECIIQRSHSFQSKFTPNQQLTSLHLDLKYLFQHSIYSKILKLRELFIDFDRDTNKMMEVGEIKTMFKENNINVSQSELISLFFKHTCNFHKSKRRKLYLTFYQFIEFCLSDDQEFRLFMRKIKLNNRSQSLSHDKDKKFFPMNFNALLDYFIIKGEERKAKRKINNAIYNMNRVVNKNQNDKVLLTEINTNNNRDNNRDISNYDVIDFCDIFNEFEKLFILSQSDVVKKKRAISALSQQQKLKLHNRIQYVECKNLFRNSIVKKTY